MANSLRGQRNLPDFGCFAYFFSCLFLNGLTMRRTYAGLRSSAFAIALARSRSGTRLLERFPV